MKREVRAVQVAMANAIVGAVAKFAAGIASGSMALLSSAADSLGDLFVSAANIVVLRVSHRAPDAEYNYGHAKIEGLGAMFEGGFICAAGGFIIYQAIARAIAGETGHDSFLGIVVMLPLLGLTLATVAYLRRVARETGSLVLKADALHYTVDIWTNLGVLATLILVELTGEPRIDTVVSIALALYLMYSATTIIREGFDVIMDRSLDPALVVELRQLLIACDKIESFHDFKTRGGKLPVVDFHVVVDPDMTTRAAHDLFLELQAGVRAIVGPATKVLVHVDPAPRESRSGWLH
ncbi:cation diffusion facilitator family transporter [Nannocystis pusilla]|uniref:cation diffusion facilitator family transporter n=1 Tax=Nannocystis pusilla TaxID=889268 RepID=UPI003BF06EEC